MINKYDFSENRRFGMKMYTDGLDSLVILPPATDTSRHWLTGTSIAGGLRTYNFKGMPDTIDAEY